MRSRPPTATHVARQLRPGTKLGRYTLLRPLGHGGMAELYLALIEGPKGFRKRVALKLVLPHLAAEPTFVDMFVNEARIAGLLDHPNIAAVYELGQERGEYFFAMEHVDGADLRSLLARVGRGEIELPLECAIAIVAHTASALDYAHQARDATGKPLQIVHRDVSPSNILVRHDGCVKLVDFGIAKVVAHATATRSGVLKGKVGYMSPEQCIGEAIDRRSDVFSLGIVLYESTTGRRLFVGDNEFATMNRIVRGDVSPPSAVRPGYPAELERIVLRALKTDPSERYPTAEALRAELEALAQREGLSVSQRRLAVWMRDIGCGEATAIEEVMPIDTPTRADDLHLHAADPLHARRARLGSAIRTVAALGAGAALAAWMMQPGDLDRATSVPTPAPDGAPSSGDEAPTLPPAIATPSSRAEAVPRSDAPPRAEAPELEAPTNVAAPSPETGPAAAEASSDVASTSAPRPEHGNRSKKRRPRRSRSRRDPPSPEALDAMFPGGS